jgi:hypothetical protein
MSGVKSGMQTGDISKINNAVSDSVVKGTSLPDVQDQAVKRIGIAPVRENLNKSPVQKEEEDFERDRFSLTDISRAVMRDSNASATKLVDLEGLPE